MTKRLRDILEGTVIDFPTSLAKRRKSSGGEGKVTTMPGVSLDPHERHEKDFEMTDFKSKEEMIKHPLVDQLNNQGFTIMKKGFHEMDTHTAHDAIMQLSGGIKHAKSKGTKFHSYPAQGVYFGQHKTGHFEDGYSGRTGLAIKHGAAAHEIGDYFHHESPHHKPGRYKRPDE